MNERPIPEAAARDQDAVEMLRVWIAEMGLHCSSKVGMYVESTSTPEESTWRRILADIARHVANALEGGFKKDARESLKLMIDAVRAELEEEPVNTRGGFINRH